MTDNPKEYPYPIGPLAESFPPLSPAQHAALVVRIAQHSFRPAVIVWREEIIFGVALLKAYKEAGVEPRFEQLADDADPTTLLSWNAQGMTTVEMQKRLAAQGTTASVDLIRLRLREARRNAQGKPPAPKPQRKDSATHRRQGQLAEAVNLVTALRDDLQGVLDGWGDSFAGSERYGRFAVAVGELEGIAETLGDIDVSWG